jgi:hypothetical protein
VRRTTRITGSFWSKWRFLPRPSSLTADRGWRRTAVAGAAAFMAYTPGPIRWHYRQVLKALVERAIMDRGVASPEGDGFWSKT